MVKGNISLKKLGEHKSKIQDLKVILAHGILKKVYAKDIKAWTVIETRNIATDFHVAEGDGSFFPWEFKLSDNSPVTDKDSSLFLLYGVGDDLLTYGHLQLNVDMRPALQQFLDIFVDFFRFKAHSKKWNKNQLEIKLIPPNTKEMTTFKDLVIRLKEVDGNIELKYIFTVKTLGIATAGVKAVDTKKEFEQVMTKSDYLIYGSSPNYDRVKKLIEEILTQARPKLLY